MVITSVITTGHANSVATIQGTGFGLGGPNAVLQFYPVSGAPVSTFCDGWADTSISYVGIPANATVGAQGYFVVQLEDGTSARSESFTILAEAVTPMTWLEPGMLVFGKPGALSVEI